VLLSAAVIPPLSVRQELAELVAGAGAAHQLDAVSARDMQISLAGFRNLPQGEAVRLAATLRDAAAGWESPLLRFGGATALEWPSDRSVWVTLGGDVDQLTEIARKVPIVAQQLGLFLDRRRFRPWLEVGSVNGATTAPYLEKLVATLDDFSADWRLDSVSLLRPRWDDPGSVEGVWDVFEELELASA
jgi:2'-5' RNA ligase